MDAQTAASKPSGIPRPGSKLPVLNKRPSQIALSRPQQNTATSADRRPRLQKRSSIASFSRSTHEESTSTAPKLPPLRAPTTGVKKPSNISTGPRIAPRPSSRGNQQRRPPSPRKPVYGPEDEENHDQLSSLDSFRSASRQGFQDESPTEPPEAPPFSATPKSRKPSRPSLSDRTIESLQNVPTTPKDRRRSSFFSPVESPMGPPPRPASSLSRNGSDRSSRPGTSDGSFARAAGASSVGQRATSSSAKPATRTSLGGFGFTPRTSSRLPSASRPLPSRAPEPPRSPSPSKRPPAEAQRKVTVTGRVNGVKTVSGRASKPRPALSDAFGPAARPGGAATDKSASSQGPSKRTTVSPASSKTTDPTPTSNKSSSALKQQIAAAKAAARKEKMEMDQSQDPSGGAAGSLDGGFGVDPFNQAPSDEKHILRNRINTARMDGKLNIAALGLKEIPEAVMRMYDAAAMEGSNVSWAEVVDLTRLNAADNEIAELADSIFPDLSAADFDVDDDTAGNQFGGLEMLDLHGNRLSALPMGLRRLERLTTLNLSHNRLENGALEVITQIGGLRDLRLGHNALSGSLPASISSLQQLEALDLQANRLLTLPEALQDLVRLRVLNVSGNKLTTLPMTAIQNLELAELDASSNMLVGPLFPPDTAPAHPTLQRLQVANNSLAALSFSEPLQLPRLQTLDVTNNHLTSLPSVADWSELITLMCGDNKITEIPHGFTRLTKLRNVNFASNAIRLIDPEIGRMESLEGLVLASNPLRDKKFLTMNAHDIKRDLQARLEPADTDDLEDSQSHETSANSVIQSASSTPSIWKLGPNGLLDLSNRGLSDAVNDTLGAFLQSHEARDLSLSCNKLTTFPPALWLAQSLRVLDLSANTLSGADYLSDSLNLPQLQELNLSRSTLTTLEALQTHLIAPQLRTIDLSANRLIGAVPALTTTYPSLTTLFASDNKFTSVSAEALRGLHTVNLQSNALEALPAEIGLLWDEGLRSLEVGRNAFRVPSHRVLEKGTEGVMKWLRGRVVGYEGD